MTKTPFNKPYIDVMEYGAKGDGSTNDTAAIQAALDFAFTNPTRIPVYLPAGTFMFSNLKINATVILQGASMSVTKLKRITGSTGTALREKTAAEGNASGASGIWLRDFHIDGNATAGDGFNIGNQVAGAQLNFLASMENLWAANFPSGTGMIITTNAMKNSYLWSNTNSKGFVISGGGSMWDGIWAENNTNTDIEIGSIGDTFSHVQTETAASAKPIVVTGNANRLLGVYAALGGTGIVRVVELQGTLNHVLDLLITTNSNTFTHGVYQTTAAVGTGSSLTQIPEWYDRKLVQKFGVGQTAATYSASITLNMTTSDIHYINATNTSAFTINAPSNAQSGMRLIVWIQNGSGGTLGTVTWDAVFKLAGAFTNPANGKGRMVEFITNGTTWFEVSRTAADF
jgi:hypothetical protein